MLNYNYICKINLYNHYYMKICNLLTVVTLCATMVSCSTQVYRLDSVRYQSVRTTFAQPDKLPKDASIAVEYFVDARGYITPVVINLTERVLTVDLRESFLIDAAGRSIMYYDNTVHTTTTGSFSSETNSTTFNLGGIAGAFGIGGPLGSLMGATTLGNASTIGGYSSNTVSIADTPTTAIGPKGRIALKSLDTMIGTQQFNTSYIDARSDRATRFRVCISYSLEEGEKDKLVTDFYVNSQIKAIIDKGRTSDAFRGIYAKKPDALVERSFVFYIDTDVPSTNTYHYGSLIDYK